jgi:excisionase family DNA binding protein
MSLVTARELAQALGLKPATVLDQWQRGELPGHKIGRAVRFDLQEILALTRRERPDAGRNVLANHPRPAGSRLRIASEPKEER